MPIWRVKFPRFPCNPAPNDLRDWIDRAASRTPAKPWLVCADDDRTLIYGELREATGRIATFLRDRGIGRNDRVALLAHNSIEHLLTYFGVMAYGATICTVHVEMNRNQLDNIFERLQPKLVLHQEGLDLDDLLATLPGAALRLGHWNAAADDTFFGDVAGAKPSAAHTDAGPDDDAVILFTSGTSARPKGVVLSYREHLSNIDPSADGFGITADDRVYDFRSFNWASAQLLGALVPVNRGATLVMAEKFSASRFSTISDEHRRDRCDRQSDHRQHPAQRRRGCEARPALKSLRFITSSSAPLMVEEWRRFESNFGIASRRATARAKPAGSRPFPANNGALARSAGRWPIMISRSWSRRRAAGAGRDRPSRDRRLSRSRLSLSGRGRQRHSRQPWPHPHRRSWPPRHRRLSHAVGREKELIIRGGVNISPVEIDGFLMQHPALIEVATVGVPDAIYGEEVVAYVVARPGTTIDERERAAALLQR